MKKLCSLLLMFVSLSSLADETNTWSGTFAVTERGKLSAFSIDDQYVGRWNKVTHVYKLSDDVQISHRGEGFLGRGFGLDYKYENNVTLRGALIRNPETGHRIPALTLKFSF